MMSSKQPRKVIKSVRGSPMRKEHMMKKSMRPSSPLRSSRPPPMKRLSPGMKRGHLMASSSKNLHPSRIRSIASSPHRSVARHSIPSPPVSMDRSRSFKSCKYEKRKGPSISPVRHPSPLPIIRQRRDSSPYPDDRYLNSRPAAHEGRLEPPQPKKKIRRDSGRFPREQSPTLLRKSNDIPFISDGAGLSLRSEITSHTTSMPMMSRGYLPPPTHDERVERNFRTHHSPPPVPSNQSKRPQPPQMKTSYDNPSGERYKTDVPSMAFPSGSDKPYAPTLHERFSNAETTRSEPRIRYSREDLEKITIDIRRNLREQSPTLRQIVNPNDVKLVRRANEGHRPIFDREEIKQAPRDMREDAYYEKKVMSGEGPYHQSQSIGLRDVENYEITRHRFDGHHPPFQPSGSRSLSDRWQNPDVRKDSGTLDRDEREREYEKMQSKKNYVEARNRSKSGDRDFRSQRYPVTEMPRGRSDYHNSHSRSIPTSSEQRHFAPKPQIIHHKESSHPEIRRRLGMKKERMMSPPLRSDSRSHFHPPSEKRYPENLSREKHGGRRSPVLLPHKYRHRSRSVGREEKTPEFQRRTDKYSYKSWPDKRDSPPQSYIPHGKEMMESHRGRGNSRPFRSSRGFRSRGFRGMPRGTFRGRGSYSGGYRGSSSPRGRGAPRRGRYSPHLWEHDLYARLTPERK